MSDTNTITVPIASTGKEEAFAKLTLEDVIFELLPADAKKRKAKLLENLKATDATREEMLGELERFDEDNADPQQDDLKRLVDTQAGRIEVVQFAYRKANPKSEGRLRMGWPEIYAVLNPLLAPFGWEFGPAKADEPEAKGEAAAKDSTECPPGQGYGSTDPVPVGGGENPTQPAYGR